MSKTHAFAEEVRGEHEAVRARIDDLKAELQRLSGEPGPGHDPGQMREILYDFEGHLKRHFQLEEKDGLFSDVSRFDASSQRTASQLVLEHRTFENRLHDLIESVEWAESGMASLPDAFVRGTEQLIEDLQAHERAENELVQSVFATDLGGGD